MKKYKVCIVGSGAGAGPVAYELSKAGYSVVVLEKGPWIKTADFNKDEIVSSRRDVYTPSLLNEPQVIAWENDTGTFTAKANTHGGIDLWNGSCVGGSSNLMSAYFHRMKPKDFKLLSTYGHIEKANVADWPVSYAEMEPYFTKVEEVIGVSGKVVHHSQQEPRSTPDFPYPPLAENVVSQWIDKACRKINFEDFPLPRGILSRPKGSRNACYYSDFCGSYGCSSDAKGSSRVALLHQAVATGNCDIFTYAKVFHLKTNGRRKVVNAYYQSPDKTVHSVEADIFVVAAQAIETSRLLLLSKNKEFENGLANNNFQVGKNLIFSGGGAGSGVFYKEDFGEKEFAELLKPGVFVNRSIQQWYEIDDEAFGGKAKGGSIDFLFEHANGIGKAIRQNRDAGGHLLYGSEYKKKLHQYFIQRKKLTFEVFNDWLPIKNCFVSIDDKVKDRWGVPVASIRIDNHPHDLKVGNYLADKAKKVLEALGARDISASISGNPPPNLQAGGCRFGVDPKTSVLDKNCKAHEVDNLYISDGSFMPTGGSVPYTWTIYANAFRVADKILDAL
jgi:choline dehydrogenase-like flavoprotein